MAGFGRRGGLCVLVATLGLTRARTGASLVGFDLVMSKVAAMVWVGVPGSS